MYTNQRHRAWRWATVILFFIVCLRAGAQECTGPGGTDFWATWFENAYKRENNTCNTPLLSFIIAGQHDATVTISNPSTGYSRTISHTGGSKTVADLPPESDNILSGEYDYRGFHITSTAPINLFASNFYKDSWDVCNILPSHLLGKEYIVQDYSGVSQPFAAEVAMVATEDNTHVSMVLPCPVAGLSLAVGDTFSATLQTGQSLMLRGTTAATFCGMPVSADKPIALFQGHTCAIVGATGGRDLCLEQARPLSMWGTDFVVTPTLDRTESDYVVITAGADNCTFTIHGTSLSGTLQRGQTYLYPQLNGTARRITTTAPASVSLLPASYNNGGTLGDPAMVTINPVDRWTCRADIPLHNANTNPYDEQYITDNHHYLNIVTLTAATSGMRLDGQPVSGFAPVDGTYSYARLHAPPGAHTLANDQGSFTAHAYGLGKWVCYAFETGIPARISSPMRDTVEYRDTTCQGEVYSGYGFRFDASHASPGTFHLWDSVNLGDTLRWHVLHLEVLPSSNVTVEHRLTWGDTLWLEGTTPVVERGHYGPYTRTARNGCDSLVTHIVEWAEASIACNTPGCAICTAGKTLTLTAQGVALPIWASTPADPSLDTQQNAMAVTVAPRTATTYYLLAGNRDTLASTTVHVGRQAPVSVEQPCPYIDRDNPTVLLHDRSEGRASSTWTFYNGIVFHGARCYYVPPFPLPDTVHVTLTTCNHQQCCDDTTIAIPVINLNHWFPNAFTPGQPTNNTFGCHTSVEAASFEMHIYNRAGLLVWSTHDIHQRWDGTHDGTPMPQAAYVYTYYLRDTYGNLWHNTGTVTLLR